MLSRENLKISYFVPVRMRSIAVSVSVCLSDCLSARILQKHTCPNFTKFSVRFPWQWLGGLALPTVQCYVFPVLWMTLCFHIMGRIKNQVIFRRFRVRQVAAPRGDVCSLRLPYLKWIKIEKSIKMIRNRGLVGVYLLFPLHLSLLTTNILETCPLAPLGVFIVGFGY